MAAASLHDDADFAKQRHDSHSPVSHLDKDADRVNLLLSLRGRTVHVPSLDYLTQHWPKKTNGELNNMREDVSYWLKSTIPPGKALDAFLDSDFGLFGATWWPCASFEQLRIVTYLAVWLFTWDDEIDISEGAMWNDFDEAQRYRDQTLAYVRFALGLDAVDQVVHHPIILNFKPIGEAIRHRYDIFRREIVYQEMAFYMETSETEQRIRLSGRIPTVTEFWDFRLGSSAVGVCLALNEFSWDSMSLPADVYADDDVKTMFKCTNTIICAVNDLLSVKKEIKRDAVDSLLPILYFRTGDIQAAVTDVVTFLEEEVRTFDAAAESFLQKYCASPIELQNDIRDFVDGCKQYVTGNLSWSLETNRYGVSHAQDGSGNISIVL
ncbi:terpenoid synthase [Lophiostoma macrostomum CBS 122681]|uniref:Terpene synthase n=1 Tax=Lophiostoma macrostomum CBS 122681 TaxID=1314788 RepID=A0A6A6T5Q8_9PLEO|nr:terpenoid synthase [Lophiostoma macrostomum CBS 122681]